MKICAISDTHTQWQDLVIPECDLLISAGDYSFRGEKHIVEAFHKWLAKQPAAQIISVQGNHEVWVSQHFHKAREMVERISHKIKFVDNHYFYINGFKFYCSSVTPKFGPWAYGMESQEIKNHWDEIYDDTQVLITHGPPFGILDILKTRGEHLGCASLRMKIASLKNLKLHVFGHIHDSSGIVDMDGVTYINASICNEQYKAVHPVRIFELK